ncbi:MAG: hypothetical protein RLP44_12115 [Aggregatilineales bacterium]
MSKPRFVVIVFLITAMFFACGVFTQEPDNIPAMLTMGVLCSIIPLVGFAFGWYAWRTGFSLGMTPRD